MGLFMAFVPIPFQMVLAAAAAIPCRVNLPISVGLVWITNPLTIPPMFYGAYKLGALILRRPADAFHFELSFEWLMQELTNVWEPFLLGCFILGLASAVLGYGLIRAFWRWHVVRNWEQRKESRCTAREAKEKLDH